MNFSRLSWKLFRRVVKSEFAVSKLTIWGVFIFCAKNLENFGIICNFFCLFFDENFRQGCQNWLLRVQNINFRKRQSEEPKCGRKQFSCLLSKHYRRFCRKWIPRVRNDNLRNIVFVENNMCFHHFRLMSENFSASLLNFFRWDSQNCIFYLKKNKVRKNVSFKNMYVFIIFEIWGQFLGLLSKYLQRCARM